MGNTEPSRGPAPEGVETRREGSQLCRRCNRDKSLSEYYKKDRNTGRLDTTCKACRIIEMRERALGITQEQYMELQKKQNGRCGICLHRIRSRIFKKLAVDHCHTTGRIRGLLCSQCNTAIGLFKDNPEWMMRAATWVTKV